MNTKLFTKNNVVKNEAGGTAYRLKDTHALAQLAATSCLNGAYYASAEEQLDTVRALAKRVPATDLAKIAVYSAEVSKMKDMPVVLLVTLLERKEYPLVEKIFFRICKTQKSLRNFCQLVRSGQFGRKSFGTFAKNLVKKWLDQQSAESLFRGSVGNSPSLVDVIRMMHAKPNTDEKQALYRWLLSKEVDIEALPSLVREFERFKNNPDSEVPNVDFRMLSNLTLNTQQWSQIAINASWNTLRMNLNLFAKHGVFDDSKNTKLLADKLSDKNTVRRENVFPYQLFTTAKNIKSEVPKTIFNALNEAMETACENIPSFDCSVAVCVDVSGSMSSPITGHRAGSTTTTSCVDVAALVASCVARKNKDSIIIPFDTYVRDVEINPYDSILTNTKKLSLNGGGTDLGCALEYLLRRKELVDLVIFVSDNQSWFLNNGKTSRLNNLWKQYKTRNNGAKCVLIDIQPYTTTQLKESDDVLNIGGFSDSVFEVIQKFVSGDKHNFVKDVLTTAID